jgi:hypothetical protein
VDTFTIRYLDRYAEQLWDTMLAKTPEITLFQYSNLLRPAEAGDRNAWSGLHTSFDSAELEKWHAASASKEPIDYAAVAGYSLSKVNAVLGKLGNPIGIASYKPYQSTGEDFLHNYLGMIGIPIEMHPEFPASANTILLTEDAKFDPAIVSKIKAHLEKGGNVDHHLRPAAGAGRQKQLDQIVGDWSCHRQRPQRCTDYWGAYGAGGGANLGSTAEILVPEMSFMTNDAWPVVRGTANGRGAPLLLMDRYSKGMLYVLTIPENMDDLYVLPQPVLTAIKQYLMQDFPVQIDAPSKVSLFAYDNHTFVVESFLDAPAQVTVTALGSFSQGAQSGHRRDSGKQQDASSRAEYRRDRCAERVRRSPRKYRVFHIEIAPHSFAAFSRGVISGGSCS